jgi:hypothetical protein
MKAATKRREHSEPRPEVEYLSTFGSVNGVDVLHVFRVGDNVVHVRVTPQHLITVEMARLTLDAARSLLEGVAERCNAEKK